MAANNITYKGVDYYDIRGPQGTIYKIYLRDQLVYERQNKLHLSISSGGGVKDAKFDFKANNEDRQDLVVYTLRSDWRNAESWDNGARTGISVYTTQAEVNTAMSNEQLKSALQGLVFASDGIVVVGEKSSTATGMSIAPSCSVSLQQWKKDGDTKIWTCFESDTELTIKDIIYPIGVYLNVQYVAAFLHWQYNYKSNITINGRSIFSDNVRRKGNADYHRYPNLSGNINSSERGVIRDAATTDIPNITLNLFRNSQGTLTYRYGQNGYAGYNQREKFNITGSRAEYNISISYYQTSTLVDSSTETDAYKNWSKELASAQSRKQTAIDDINRYNRSEPSFYTDEYNQWQNRYNAAVNTYNECDADVKRIEGKINSNNDKIRELRGAVTTAENAANTHKGKEPSATLDNSAAVNAWSREQSRLDSDASSKRSDATSKRATYNQAVASGGYPPAALASLKSAAESAESAASSAESAASSHRSKRPSATIDNSAAVNAWRKEQDRLDAAVKTAESARDSQVPGLNADNASLSSSLAAAKIPRDKAKENIRGLEAQKPSNAESQKHKDWKNNLANAQSRKSSAEGDISRLNNSKPQQYVKVNNYYTTLKVYSDQSLKTGSVNVSFSLSSGQRSAVTLSSGTKERSVSTGLSASKNTKLTYTVTFPAETVSGYLDGETNSKNFGMKQW